MSMKCASVQTQRGHSLVEILIAMSVLVIAISTLAYLLLSAQVSIRETTERQRASDLVTEGLSAVTAIAERSFGNLAPGTHGLAFVGGEWVLSGTQELIGKYARSVSLEAIDTAVYQVQSQVVWELSAGKVATSTAVQYVANWQQTDRDASCLLFDVSGADYVPYASGTVALTGITAIHSGTGDSCTHTTVTITNIQGDWDGLATLQSITVEGLLVYDTGSSSGALSGEQIDVVDVGISSGGPVSFGPVVFTDAITSSGVLFTLYFDDGSEQYVRAKL